MKVSISYPPIQSEKGVPLLSQNRQFQWFKRPTYIYPMVPAYAATLLATRGHDVIWDDGIAEELQYTAWIKRLEERRPELVMIESKTPVIKRHWKIIDEVKQNLPDTSVVLAGDHVTALPEESFRNSSVDYVLSGGDYDFLLLNLVEHLENGTDLEPGIWYRGGGDIKRTGAPKLDHDLDTLPFIDRELTRWDLYAEKNGNFKRVPGTYTYVGRDCWWGKCTFCSWTTTCPGKTFRSRTPESLLDEVGILIERYGVKEVFDDTGTFPAGKWLRTFAEGMIERGYNEKITFSCNMRFNALDQKDYELIRRANFRMLLFGIESANNATLERLNKGVNIEQMVESCELASKAGLEPHITIMFGHPWETREEAQKTRELGLHLLRKGIASTVQATLVIPYPGTPLFEEAKENGWLKTEDWDLYDMKAPVMRAPISDKEIMELIRSMFKVAFHPEFLVRKVLSIRNWQDARFIARAGVKVVGHLFDFKARRESAHDDSDGKPL